jgi:hypothetical protein
MTEAYRPLPIKDSVGDHSRLDEQYRIFLGKVVSVDWERKVIAIRDEGSKGVHHDIAAWPALASSVEGTDVTMPEIGSSCLACTLEWTKGYARIGIVTWITSSTTTAQDAITTRHIAGDVPSWSERLRGVYRKAYPGQHTIAQTEGYTAKLDQSWDHAAADFSRDKVDSFRRTHFTSTGRAVERTDSSLKYEGFVHRPQASSDDITPHILPDGSKEWVLYLDWKEKDYKTRYFSKQQDMMPFVEKMEKIQEFGLDYPLPLEMFETDMWDKVLGLTRPSSDWWSRTSTLPKNAGPDQVEYDDETYLVDQPWDHPDNTKKTAIGPSRKEGQTPRRRGWIIEKSQGTLVGSNMFDPTTYSKVLKPTIFPLNRDGRFGSNTQSGYIPVNKTQDQVEAKMAASASSTRFPYEYNTTRWDITKEGMVQFEFGSTIPKEKIMWDSSQYEHPYGAGRSVEGHVVGSTRLTLGKNRDEEDSLDVQTIGGTVLRLGADDASTPDARRSVQTQIRGKKDAIDVRDLQYWDWSNVKLTPGDAGDLTNKTGAENVSLRSAMDGGMFLRLGARDVASKRRHLYNGYKDGQGKDRWDIKDPSRKDARSPGRPHYGAGDSNYRFHDLTKAGSSQQGGTLPYGWSGDPVGDMDTVGLSADLHAVRDVLLRIGANERNGQSLLLDTAGGVVAALGMDKQGRSLTAALDGGIEMTVGENNQHKGVRLEINGDVDVLIKGNLHLNVTGDIITESCRNLSVAKIAHITRSLVVQAFAQVLHTTEAPEVINNQGAYQSESGIS